MAELFADRRRTDAPPARPGEAAGPFLDRSANPVFGRVRERMSAWHAQLPDRARADSASRLTGGDEGNFRSAWAELYTHAVLRHLGFELEDHPAMATSSARPDYVARRDAQRMLVEVTVLGDGEDPGKDGGTASSSRRARSPTRTSTCTWTSTSRVLRHRRCAPCAPR